MCLLNFFYCVGDRLESFRASLYFPPFAWIPCPLFSLLCLILSNLLVPESCCEGRGVRPLFYLDLSNVYLCGIGRSNMDG